MCLSGLPTWGTGTDDKNQRSRLHQPTILVVLCTTCMKYSDPAVLFDALTSVHCSILQLHLTLQPNCSLTQPPIFAAEQACGRPPNDALTNICYVNCSFVRDSILDPLCVPLPRLRQRCQLATLSNHETFVPDHPDLVSVILEISICFVNLLS